MPADLSPGFKNEKRFCMKEDLALQNIQARSRMVYSYKLAQMLSTPAVRDKTFLLVLGSANVDEALFGYYTKYDCSAADLNPIGGVCKTDLKMFLKWAGRTYKWPALIETEKAPPSAELRPAKPGEKEQADEDDMGLTYAELSDLGKLRKVNRMGIYAMTRRLIDLWGSRESISSVSIATEGPDVSETTTESLLKSLADATMVNTKCFEDVEVDFVGGQNRISARIFLDRDSDGAHDRAHAAVEAMKKGRAFAHAPSQKNVFHSLKVVGGAVKRVQLPLSPDEVKWKVERFYKMHMQNRHKMTTLTPSYHAENYSPDDNRFDLRPFCYKFPLTHQWNDVNRLVASANRRNASKAECD